MRVLPLESVADTSLATISGLSLVRGEPCPVLDLSKLLGSEQPCQRWVLIRVPGSKERRVVLAVSSVEGVATISSESLLELPPLLSAGHSEAVKAIAIHDQQLMTVLEAGALLDEKMWAALETS